VWKGRIRRIPSREKAGEVMNNASDHQEKAQGKTMSRTGSEQTGN